jgi:MFS family permease
MLDRRTRVALAAMALAVFVIANDFTSLTVALPQIERTFDLDVSTVQWVMNAYTLVFGVPIITAGRLSDMLGRRRMFFTGITIFAAFGNALGPMVGDRRPRHKMLRRMHVRINHQLIPRSHRHPERNVRRPVTLLLVIIGVVHGPVTTSRGRISTFPLFIACNAPTEPPPTNARLNMSGEPNPALGIRNRTDGLSVGVEYGRGSLAENCNATSAKLPSTN